MKPLTLTTGRVILLCRRLCDAESGIGAVYAVLTALVRAAGGSRAAGATTLFMLPGR